MKRFFAVVVALAFMASPGAVWANGENGNGHHRNRTNINIRNRNTNRNTNLNLNLNKNRNSNRNYNTNVNVNKNSNRQHQGQAQGQYQGQGQHQGQVGIVKDGDVSIQGDTYNSKSYASAPDAIAPALTSGNDVCMGSVSVSASGGSGIIGVGLGFGRTYTDENCVRLKNANALLQMGHKDAALALLALNEDVAAALKAAGVTFATLEVPEELETEKVVTASSTTTNFNLNEHEEDDTYWGIDFEDIGD